MSQISLPSIHKGKPVIGIAMQINYDPSVVSLSSMDTPYGTLQADSTVVLPADPQTGGDSVKTTTDLTTVANPQGGPATDVRGVSTLAQNTNTGPLRSCQSDADCPTSTVGRGLCLNGQCQSPVDPNAAPPVEMNGGGTGSLGSIVVDPEGTAVVKVSLSPAQADPLLTLRFQALASAADAGLTLSSIHYLTADGEDIVMPDASLGTSGDTTTPSADETSAGSGAYIVGDVNNDGVINSVDLLIIKEYLGSSDAQALDEADFNTDGAVNVQDYSMAITSFTQQFDE
ncbi:MAG: Dockerin type I repeat protein [Microgenomates bacterium OLB22]|nr:MAG: Dockerin type I repeat protein [Microgenomates bacterium OLB22]